MSFKQVASIAILDYIKASRISDILAEAKNNRELILDLHTTVYFSDEELEIALEKAVLNEARRTINFIRETERYADCSRTNPEYLSYAIRKGHLDTKQLKIVQTHLNNERDLEEFCRRYESKGFIQRLRQQFLNPNP